jgi:hypothetical protein
MSDIPVGGPGAPLAQGHLEAHRILSERVGRAPLFAELADEMPLPGPAITTILSITLPGPAKWWIYASVLLQSADTGNHDLDVFFGVTAGNIEGGPRSASVRLSQLVVPHLSVSIGPCRVNVSGASLAAPLQVYTMDAGARALARSLTGNLPGATAMAAIAR